MKKEDLLYWIKTRLEDGIYFDIKLENNNNYSIFDEESHKISGFIEKE